MTSRDLVVNTLNHEPVARAPRDLWASPEVESARPDELAEIEARYPKDIVKADFQYPAGTRAKGKPHKAGKYTDSWGCTWRVTERGATRRIAQSPLAKETHIDQYQPPFEMLDGAKLAKVDRDCAATSRFVLAWTEIRPFERLLSLRGTDAALDDLAHGAKRIQSLLAMLHDFFCREAEMWAKTDVDGVAIMDNWGSQQELLVAAGMWRDLFKPLYKEYCKIIHDSDKFTFFHSDGQISEIFGDLVKIGADAINSQLFLMNIERLAKQFRGRTTFWGDIDRHFVLTFSTPEEVREAVLRVRRALDFGSGGVIAQCQWGVDVPLKNIATVFEQWMLPLPMHAT